MWAIQGRFTRCFRAVFLLFSVRATCEISLFRHKQRPTDHTPPGKSQHPAGAPCLARTMAAPASRVRPTSTSGGAGATTSRRPGCSGQSAWGTACACYGRGKMTRHAGMACGSPGVCVRACACRSCFGGRACSHRLRRCRRTVFLWGVRRSVRAWRWRELYVYANE